MLNRFLALGARITVAGLCLALAGCLSCSIKQNPDQLKEKTADTTAALKRDAKAVAAGVREGWSRDKPLDLNKASREQLDSLPGITPTTADRIIANRPYAKSDELVSRRVLSRPQYERISPMVTAKK